MRQAGITGLVESAASSIYARDRRVRGTAVAVCGLNEEIVGTRFAAPPPRRGSRRRADGSGGCARATVPACWDGHLRGALATGAGDGRRFGTQELELLDELATSAGAALEDAERRHQLLRAIRARITKLLQAIDAHDGYTRGHSEGVMKWTCTLGQRLRLSRPERLELGLGALLHDLGKVRVPKSILRKPAPLDHDERVLVGHHPAWGAEILQRVPGLEPVATIVRSHHERWDGTGYPDGLEGDRIPVASRIIAVCDAYEAMTSSRPYRAALPPAAAASELRAAAGTQFDSAVADCFVELLQERGRPLSPAGERETARTGGTR